MANLLGLAGTAGGTAVGGPIGGIIGGTIASGIGSLFGKSGKKKQNQLYTPQQQQQLQQLSAQGGQTFNQGQNLFNQGIANSDPSAIESQARRQFQQQTIPSIAERFANMGANRGSSGLYGSLGGAGANLESQLGALRSQYGLQQAQLGQGQQQLGLSQQQLGLRPTFENYYQEPQAGFAGSALNGLGKGLTNMGLEGLKGAMYGNGDQNSIQGLLGQLKGVREARNSDESKYQDIIANLRSNSSAPSLSPPATPQPGYYNAQQNLLGGRF